MKNIEEVRNSIVEAAEKCFSVLGFEKTTLGNITDGEGRSKTSVYYHFKNKHDIFKSVIEKEFASVRDDLQKVIDKYQDDRKSAMREYLRKRIESISKQGAFRHFASSRFALGDNLVSRTVASARCQFDNWEKDYLKLNVANGIAEGSIPPGISPDVFAVAVVSILKALEIQILSGKDKWEDIKNTYNGVIELIIR